MPNYLHLNKIDAYKNSFHLSNKVWDLVLKWEHFSRSTVGNQFVRAVDSISANIAEGFGRHFKKDKILFYRMAKGSVLESLDWNLKAKARKLITEKEYQEIEIELKTLIRLINQLIQYTKLKLKE